MSDWEHTWLNANKVCVVGAGAMGGGIAAHLANLGFEVTLLDLTRTSVDEAFARTRNARPPAFYLHERANSIRLGSFQDNLEWVSEADWVCEAIVERADSKCELFEIIEPLLPPDAMISTNTSGLKIEMLASGRSDTFKSRFIGTHFFNPPRYLKLLELIPTRDTDVAATNAMTKFLEERVGRRVVVAKDVPGFIANRYGMWCMFHAIHVAEKLHLTIEQVDEITGPFLGRPKTGSFRLNDLVGIDVMQHIAHTLLANSPSDKWAVSLQTPNSMRALLDKRWIGQKIGRGYYRSEGKELLALDLGTMAYRHLQQPDLPTIAALGQLPFAQRVSEALRGIDEVGEFLRHYLPPCLQYANAVKEEVSHGVRDFDRVMEWGFGWNMGPFAMIDALGAERVGVTAGKFYDGEKAMVFPKGFASPKREPQYATVQDFHVVQETDSYRIRDLGDGVSAVCLTSKMGILSPKVVEDLIELFDNPKHYRLVLTSEAKSFSAGYDLGFFMELIGEANTAGIENAIKDLGRLGELLELRGVVAAVYGHCLGGGLELALSCSIIAAHPETKIGLPEALVGLIPAGRGTVLTRLNHQTSTKRLCDVCLTLASGTTAASPDEARALGLLRPSDVTIYHPDRLIFDAKKLALGAAPSLRPAWQTVEGPLSGMIDRAVATKRSAGAFTDHDVVIADKLKMVYAKSSSYEDARERERTEFLELCFRALTKARIKAMLETGKPLRN